MLFIQCLTPPKITQISVGMNCVILQILRGQFPMTRLEIGFCFSLKSTILQRIEKLLSKWKLLNNNGYYHETILSFTPTSQPREKRLFSASPIPMYFNLIQFCLYILFLSLFPSICVLHNLAWKGISVSWDQIPA